MALDDKKYEKFYKTDGSGEDKAKSADLAKAEALWDLDRAEGCEWYLSHPEYGPLIFQLQQMQDELDALRTEISANKDKAAFPGFGTSGSTCLAGDTTTITTSQASAITANTAKVSFTGLGTTLSFGKMIVTPGVKGGKTTYSIVMTVVSGVGPKAITKSVTLQLI